MNINMQPNDDESPPAAQDGTQNHGPELEAMPPVAGENHKPGMDKGPTTPLHLMSLEEIRRLVQENSEEALAQHVRQFTKDQLGDYCVTDPTFSLLFCRKLLSTEQLEYCIERDPLTGFIYASDALTEKQFRKCYRLYPGAGFAGFLSNKHDPELLDLWIRKEPSLSLLLAFTWDLLLCLTDKQFEYCSRKAPGLVLRYPSLALMLGGHSMDDALFVQCAMSDPATAFQYTVGRIPEPLLNQCALAAPGMALVYAAKRMTAQLLKQCALAAPDIALRYAAGIMSASLLKQCALAAPVIALRYASGIMNASLLKQCAQAKPWAGLRYASAHLSDAEILQYSAGRGSRIRRLLMIQPRHPLARRLIPLCDHLDPITVAAVGRAIASGI